jgi:chromosome transmission fidelity protein 18
VAQDGRRPLLRPIICICNDLYSSSLVRLRSIAKIIRFNKVPDVLLTKRLREICQIEGMRIDAHALGMLARLGQGDIRSCINALQVKPQYESRSRVYAIFLQFISQQGPSSALEITEPLMRVTFSGMKESDGSPTSVLSALFSPPTKKRTKELGLNEQEDAEQMSKFVDRLSRLIDLSGAQEKIALGIFPFLTNDMRKIMNWI